MKVIIVGGVAGGASCAARLRRLDEKAEIVMVERGRACRKVFPRPICNGIVPYRTCIDASKGRNTGV
jgi:NADPH-dependent 2,4-dienoyl-CoA reductase/sulfur reductase-like enzyme